MASISREAGGRRVIQFVGKDGRRRSIRLGKVPQSVAEAVKLKIEHLVAASLSGHALDPETARWVASLDSVLTDRLVRVGLIAKSRQPASTLGPFLDGYIAGRTDLKPLTIRHLREAARKLREFFGDSKPLADVTPGDADDYARHLMGRLGDNTARRMLGRSKQFFRAACRKRLIPENPFADLVGCSVRPNRDREFFVTRDVADRVLVECPDSQWRLIFALARFGGLRCPSEHMELQWGDIDWARNRIRITSPKTAHHEGKGSRWIPLFPELRPYLEAAFDEAPEGTTHVITRYRDSNSNLRTQLERIIRRAGLEPWEKLFQNLRSTRQTELEETYPSHVVCSWLGNSESIARKHYLQVTEDHFARAVQNPVQQPTAAVRTGSQEVNAANEETPEELVLQGSSRCTGMPPVGLEPTTY